MSELDAPRRHRALQRRLITWGEDVRRDLPWRRTRDPWAVLVSELMLQQTQVSRVVPRYEAFLERLPTATACADAPVGIVIELWRGLGYNRRAVNLHAAATLIRDRHAGRVPDDLDDLLALPGIGPYTARAVRAFAHEADVGVLDTNAARFLARAVAGRPLRPREAQALADALVPAGSGWAWNQAVLDLGATVCTKRRPGCDGCPLRPGCAWAVAGFPEPDPVEGSAGTSGRQSAFEGSDRQGRGRLVAALRSAPVAVVDLPEVMGWPDEPERARRVADSVVEDGLAERAGDHLRLPA